MRQSLREYITALGYWGLIVIAPIPFYIISLYQVASGNQFTGIPSWVWLIITFVFFLLLLIVPFKIFHKVRVQRDEALGAEQSLVLTPHRWEIGLSGREYPGEPDNADWLRLDVAVNPISKPIDTLDLLIDKETIHVNYWTRTDKAVFHVDFNVTKWRWKGKKKVELIAHVGNKMHRSGRIDIDFDTEVYGSHRI